MDPTMQVALIVGAGAAWLLALLLLYMALDDSLPIAARLIALIPAPALALLANALLIFRWPGLAQC